jgi:hypothetical protein
MALQVKKRGDATLAPNLYDSGREEQQEDISTFLPTHSDFTMISPQKRC